MTPERWRKISAVYHAALAQPTGGRAVYVATSCADDDALRREVEDLLANQSRATAFFQMPVDAAGQVQSDDDSIIGARVGPYRVHARLGAGGMGQVYRAHDDKLGRDVAIKILPSIFTTDRERLARFEREARVLAALNHPHIGAIYGLEEHAGAPALVLELVEGSTLADRLDKGPLKVAEALRLAMQIADALDVAHERGIVHRDLKPANIAITAEGNVKVLDFGLAKASGQPDVASVSHAPTASPDRTQDGVIVGTAGYTSPEQARGQSTDKRTDIWAFGCVLYEMFTGHVAFPGDTVSDVITTVLEREPDWSALPPAVPPSVVRLMRRCLEKDTKRRMRDIGDARIELESAQEPAPAAPDAPTSSRLWVPWSMAVVALAALLVVSARSRAHTGADAAPVFSKVMRLTSGPALEFGPVIAPDGKWVAYLSNAGGKIGLWVKFLSGGDATNLTANLTLELPSRIDIGGPAISPDGTTIAFDAGAAPGTPSNLFDSWVVPAPAGGVPRKLVERGRSTRWSPDGSHIAYVRAGAAAGDALYVADADATNERQLLGVRGGMHIHWISWAADGRYIYFVSTPSTSNSEPSEIHRIAVAGGAPEVIIKTARRAVSPAPLPDGSGLLYAANPFTANPGIWWTSLDASRVQRPITSAVGEYGELAVARDGQSFVSTFADVRQSLMSVALDAKSAQAMPITDGTTGDMDPTMSLQGDRLVFASSREGNQTLWTSGPDGENARPLTGGTSFDERPALSPDGRQVAFVSDRRGERGIWVMQADGGAARQLVAAPVLDGPSWSPDSRQLVYATPVDEAPGLWIADIATGNVRRLRTPGPANSPVWSPAADVIAYVEARAPSAGAPSSSHVAFVTSAGVPVSPGLTDSPNVLNGFLAWAPDGRQLAAFTDPGATASALWVLDALGKQPPRRVLALPPGVRFRGATWSPDSKRIIAGQIQRSYDVVLFQR